MCCLFRAVSVNGRDSDFFRAAALCEDSQLRLGLGSLSSENSDRIQPRNLDLSRLARELLLWGTI